MELTYDPKKVYPPNHCHNFSGRRMKALNEDKRRQVVDFVRSHLDSRLMTDIKAEILKDRELWWVNQHFTWGMKFRNFLREHGFNELAMRITDWDDYYIGVIELAAMGDDWYDDVLENDA